MNLFAPFTIRCHSEGEFDVWSRLRLCVSIRPRNSVW